MFTKYIFQQEANICDEKKDFRYRGILRRYRKYEEEMTFASNDRSPDVCVRFRDLDVFTAMLVILHCVASTCTRGGFALNPFIP